MDVRQIWNYYLVVISLVILDKGICFEEDYDDTPSFGRCPWIRNKLKNGRVKIRSRGRIAKFLCDSGYELAGKRFATCVRGQWNNPIPVCVARGCPRTPVIANGRVTEMYRGAMLVYDCNPGYSLDGVVSIHCDGRRWSTEPPACVVTTSEPEVTCDFEDPDLCGWTHDPTHDFDWKRNQFATPSGHVGTGPAYDHTFGVGKGGFYLYLEASAPRKENDKARIFSPVYPPDYSDRCFVFWYHMYGSTTGSLNVFLKPESHVFSELSPTWKKSEDQGNKWIRGNMDIPALNENFQIIIEGVRGNGYIGDTAIDDVQLMTTHCDNLENATDSVASTVAESCRGRCREADDNSSCGCNENCYLNENCCNDYATICTSGNETATESVEEIVPESDLEKTSSLKPAVVPTVMEPEVTASSDTPISSTSTNTPISDNMAPSVSILSNSSTHNDTSLTFSAVETNLTSFSTTSLDTTTFTTKLIINPTISSIESKPLNETVVFVTTPSTTTLKTTPSTTILTTTPSTTTLRTTPSTTTLTTTPSTTTTKTTSTSTTLTTTVKSTSSTTTVSPTTATTTTESTTSTTTEDTTTTTAVLTTLATHTLEPETANITTATKISNPLLLPTTNSTAYTGAVNSSDAVIIPHTHLPQITSTTVTSSSSESSRITLTPSTRKIYNLRPRTQRPTLSLSNSTPSSTSTNSSQIIVDTYTRSITTLSNTDVTKIVNTQTSSRDLKEDVTKIFPYMRLTTIVTQPSGETSSSKPYTISSGGRFPERTTRKFTFRIQTSTKSAVPVMTTTEISFNHASKEASTADKDSVPTVAITAVTIAVIMFVSGGLVYYLKKQKIKRRSKLSDDSEMRFLSDNEEMEYSDASALDRILIN